MSWLQPNELRSFPLDHFPKNSTLLGTQYLIKNENLTDERAFKGVKSEEESHAK